MTENLNNYSNLKFNFEYKNRIITCNFDKNNYFTIETPFLKVLKPMHVSLNKKKNSTKRYIILEVNENYNVNQELDDFLIKINKLHELSQESVRKNSLLWFNTEFDDIGLDLKVKKPIDIQKDKQFIKILLPDEQELLEKINNLEKNDYINSTIIYKGLRVSNEYLMGEYELINYMNQEEYEELKKFENDNNIEINEELNVELNEEEIKEEIKEEVIEEEIKEEVIEEEIKEEEIKEEIKDKEINEEMKKEINKEMKQKDIEKKKLLKKQDLENKTIEKIENNVEENNESIFTMDTESLISKSSKASNKNNKYVKIVSRKKKILILK